MAVFFFPALILVATASGASAAETLHPESFYKAFAKAEIGIERLRKAKTVNYQEIGRKYEVCAALVQDIDAAFGTRYDEQIRHALKKCNAGETVEVHHQTFAKGLQHVAVLEIRRHLDLMAKMDADQRKTAARNVAALFEGIRPTFTRRDKDYFNQKKTLELEADKAISDLQKKAGTASFVGSVRILRDAINRTYALCVLYEMQQIEKIKNSNAATCDVKKAEAVIFYRIVEPDIKKRDPGAHETILSVINADYDSVRSNLLLDALKKGLPGLTLL
jgi:hypothetical protein